MRLVKQTVNEDDQGARHLFFGDEEGRPAPSSRASSTPTSTRARSAADRPTTSRSSVESEEELGGWRDYLAAQGIPVTEVMDRAYFKSIYLRDPDGHIVELATVGGLRPTSRWRNWAASRSRRAMGGRPLPGRPCSAPVRRPSARVHESQASPAPDWGHARCISGLRGGFGSCRGVLGGQHSGQREALALCERPDLLVLGDAEGDQQPPAARSPQRFWLISRSLIDMLCACQGQLRITSAAESSPAAIRRFIRARARRTRLAYSSARKCCS